MYRIDVFHPNEKYPSTPPVYVSLATATAPDDGDDNAMGGKIVTVGRRNAPILFDKDKSVSRHHLHLHLLSNEPEHQQALLDDNDQILAQAAGVPSTQEEKDACAQNPLGMALVVKCLGKFGSAMIALALNNNNNNKDGGDDSNKNKGNKNAADVAGSETDGGSDTEDESQLPAKLAPGEIPELPNMAIFALTKTLVANLVTNKDKNNSNNFGYTILPPQKIMANEQCVIPGNATTVFLQCGQMGSLLILNRMDLQITKSGWSSKQEKLWSKQLYSVGASMVPKDTTEAVLLRGNPTVKLSLADASDSDDYKYGVFPPTTHMIVEKRDLVAKQLQAWSRSIPIASFRFLDALLQRSTPLDPWPNAAQDFPPAAGNAKQTSDIGGAAGGDDFWTADLPNNNNNNKSNNNKATLWASCTLITTSDKAKDSESIVKAAGGNVIPVYGLKDKEAQSLIQELIDDPAKKEGLFAISASRKKKIAVWLTKSGIPHLKGKDLVVALCQQRLLEDEDGRTIVGQGDATAASSSSSSTNKEKKAINSANQKEEEVVTQEKEATKSNEEEKDDKTESSKGKRDKTASSKEKSDKTESSKEKRDSSKRKHDNVADQEEEKEEPSQQKSTKRSRSNDKSRSASKAREKPVLSQQRGAMDILPAVEEEHSTLNDTAASEESHQNHMEVDEPEDEPSSNKRHRKEQDKHAKTKKTITSRAEPMLVGSGTAHLETTKDGWLVAAPKDAARRKAYLQPRHKMQENFGDEDTPLPQVAETAICSGLIRRAYDPNCSSIASLGTKSRGGKDFKKFKKNVVKRARARIELRSVLPKETERQKELEEQQRQIDTNAALADDLFDMGKGSRAKPARKRR